MFCLFFTSDVCVTDMRILVRMTGDVLVATTQWKTVQTQRIVTKIRQVLFLFCFFVFRLFYFVLVFFLLQFDGFFFICVFGRANFLRINGVNFSRNCGAASVGVLQVHLVFINGLIM